MNKRIAQKMRRLFAAAGWLKTKHEYAPHRFLEYKMLAALDASNDSDLAAVINVILHWNAK